MTDPRPPRFERGLGGLAVVTMLAIGPAQAGCRGDANVPALVTAVDPPPDHPAPASDSGAADDADPAVTGGERALFFSSPQGRTAIVARERRDHDTARQALDELLARTDLGDDERAGGQLLRALEHERAGEYAEAAAGFGAARKGATLAAIEPRVRLWEAQAWLDANEPERAAAVMAEVDDKTWSGTALQADALVVSGDALRRTQDHAAATKRYRSYLDGFSGGDRRYEVRMKLARLLAQADGDAARREALLLFDGVRRAVPVSDYADDAKKEIAALERELGPLRKGDAAREASTELLVRRAEAQLDRHRYKSAVASADKLLGKSKLSVAQRCRLGYVKGSSIFKQRRRADARTAFDKAARDCAKAGAKYETLRVKSRYQAARGWYAAGKYDKAGQAFEALAREHQKHSYADDALVLAGESWESHGDDDRAAQAYRKAIGEHPGDMLAEARRRLLVMRFAAADYDEILALTDEALAGRVPHPADRAKLHYFRGRALQKSGRLDEATEAWLEAIETAPLDYPAVQALSRLRDRGPEYLERGIARLGLAGPADDVPPIERPRGDAMARAELLARLGLGDAAAQELRHAKIKGWPAVAVLNLAGLYPAAQREIANLGAGWRRDAPTTEHRSRWEGAYPRPFGEIIGPGEQQHAVPPRLTYAIMQTESRFDPGVTSFAGAKGLVQLMPATAKGLADAAGVKIEGARALYDPTLNLDLGMRYLGRLTARYGGGDGAVALAIPSYNAGAGSVDRWLSERGTWDLDLFIESIPYDETRKYTQSVLGRWHAYRWLYGERPPAERVPYLPLTTPSVAR